MLAIYALLTQVVLVSLLITMMGDTYSSVVDDAIKVRQGKWEIGAKFTAIRRNGSFTDLDCACNMNQLTSLLPSVF